MSLFLDCFLAKTLSVTSGFVFRLMAGPGVPYVRPVLSQGFSCNILCNILDDSSGKNIAPNNLQKPPLYVVIFLGGFAIFLPAVWISVSSASCSKTITYTYNPSVIIWKRWIKVSAELLMIQIAI